MNQLHALTGDYDFWRRLTGIVILDPDGRDRSNPDSFKEEITLKEFLKRCIQCTMPVDSIKRLDGLNSLLPKKYPEKKPLNREFLGQHPVIWIHAKSTGRTVMVIELSQNQLTTHNSFFEYEELMRDEDWHWGTTPNGPWNLCHL